MLYYLLAFVVVFSSRTVSRMASSYVYLSLRERGAAVFVAGMASRVANHTSSWHLSLKYSSRSRNAILRTWGSGYASNNTHI